MIAIHAPLDAPTIVIFSGATPDLINLSTWASGNHWWRKEMLTKKAMWWSLFHTLNTPPIQCLRRLQQQALSVPVLYWLFLINWGPLALHKERPKLLQRTYLKGGTKKAMWWSLFHTLNTPPYSPCQRACPTILGNSAFNNYLQSHHYFQRGGQSESRNSWWLRQKMDILYDI